MPVMASVMAGMMMVAMVQSRWRRGGRCAAELALTRGGRARRGLALDVRVRVRGRVRTWWVCVMRMFGHGNGL